MAQVIAPEVWQEGIRDNRLLPSRHTVGLFIGNTGCKNIANNPQESCRVWDIQVTDYITDYDDRRINGLAGANTEGRDGWGASAYGVFQDVHFDSVVYTVGRHRSIAMRLFDEAQYGGPTGTWGNASHSTIKSPGQALVKKAELMNKAKTIWEAEVLGPDIDAYNLFAVMNGHISGRWVAVGEDGVDHTDHVMIPDASTGRWVAQPGPVQGQDIQPRFAPIHCIQWDPQNISRMLSAIKTAWNNLEIPTDNRCIIMNEYYEYDLLMALTGTGVPATESAYSDLQNGTFTRLMGWEFKFDIPAQYFPRLYTDKNLNVIHGSKPTPADNMYLRSVAAQNKRTDLFVQLAEAARMTQNNYVRTYWDAASGEFVKTITNYPLGQPVADGLYGMAAVENVTPGVSAATLGTPDILKGEFATTADDAYNYVNTKNAQYPWSTPGSGYGIDPTKNPAITTDETNKPKQVIGCAIYKKAAQLSQEYSEMVTDEGRTRGKFTEMCMDVKYDAWVIESLSAGIIPILAPTSEDWPVFAIPTKAVQ